MVKSWLLIALVVVVIVVGNTGAWAGNWVQFYADQCNPALPNNGVQDDAAPLRSCMAKMPEGATMNLDGNKPYYFASHSNSNPVWYGQLCETYLLSGQMLEFDGATITQSAGEASPSNIFMICAGSPNFNYPGSMGGSPTFDATADTAANATSVTLSIPADAANYNPGDDIYIDCGSDAGNADIFVGWNQVNNTNSSTGVINLMYPMLKPYAHGAAGCPGSAGSARIYDWTTSGGGSSSYNLGPMAHYVYIEGPGTLYQGAGGSLSPIVFEGTTGWAIDNITELNSGNGQFAFANNLHLGRLYNDVLSTSGCGGDTNFNAGEFTSSLNEVEYNTATLTGLGCTSGQFERAFGDSQGDESNSYSYNTATLLAGGSANTWGSTCDYTYNTWGDTFDHSHCNSPYVGFEDGGNNGQAGPTAVTNGNYTTANHALILQESGDQATGNTITENTGYIGIYIPGGSGWAQASNNVINYGIQAPYFGAIVIGGWGTYAYDSQIGPNIMSCLASNCANGSIGIYVEDPGTLLPSATLTIALQTFIGFTDDIALLGAVLSNVPQLTILTQ
jgi:hypothetical protein